MTLTLTPIDQGRLYVHGQAPAPGMKDMDWTEPCLERGTKFSFSGQGMSANDIPIVHAFVKNEIFYYAGFVSWEPL